MRGTRGLSTISDGRAMYEFYDVVGVDAIATSVSVEGSLQQT